MSQIVDQFHFKWILIHFIFIALLFILQFSKVVGENIMVSNCPEEGVLETSPIECNLKEEIVTMHNEFRQKIAQGLLSNQPSAKNMQEMHWDDELARKAQQWAHHCTFAHSDPRNRSDERFNQVGENLGLTKSKMEIDKKDFKKQIQRWFNENEKFEYGPIIPKNISKIGHYTQLASANTYMVGCGFSRYRIKNIYYRLYICHYGPSGNNFYQVPYEDGDVDCNGNLELSKRYPNLCNQIDAPPDLNCSIAATSTTTITTESTEIPQPLTTGRRFLDELPENHDIISNEGNKCKPIADNLEDKKIINNIRIEKMFNLIFAKA